MTNITYQKIATKKSQIILIIFEFYQDLIINNYQKDNNKERYNMETKQVSIQVKVDQQTWIELKQEAKRRGMFFNKYIQKLLVDSLQKNKEQK